MVFDGYSANLNVKGSIPVRYFVTVPTNYASNSHKQSKTSLLNGCNIDLLPHGLKQTTLSIELLIHSHKHVQTNNNSTSAQRLVHNAKYQWPRTCTHVINQPTLTRKGKESGIVGALFRLQYDCTLFSIEYTIQIIISITGNKVSRLVHFIIWITRIIVSTQLWKIIKNLIYQRKTKII